MIDRRIIDASMGREIFWTGRTGGEVGPEILGTGSERVKKEGLEFELMFYSQHTELN